MHLSQITGHEMSRFGCWKCMRHACKSQPAQSRSFHNSHLQIHISAIRDERTPIRAFREAPLAKAAGLLLVSRHEAMVPTGSKSPAETASRSILQGHHPVISYYYSHLSFGSATGRTNMHVCAQPPGKHRSSPLAATRSFTCSSHCYCRLFEAGLSPEVLDE